MSGTDREELLKKRLRRFLRDDPKLNKLIRENESSDRQLCDALEDAVDDWNNTPPPIGKVTIETHPSTKWLIRGAAIEILTSAGILQSRNRLSYSDGGVSVTVSDKAGDYLTWIRELVQQYEEAKREIKKTINISMAWGSVPSEYYFDRRTNGDV